MRIRKPTARVPKSDADLTRALIHHLHLVNDAIREIQNGSERYVKVLAAVLRVLVHKGGSNKPLLFVLATKARFRPLVHLRCPEKGAYSEPLKKHLKKVAFVSTRLRGIRLTNAQVIAKAAQQEGLAHEDAFYDEDYAALAVGSPFDDSTPADWPPPVARILIPLGTHVVRAGSDLLVHKGIKHAHRLFQAPSGRLMGQAAGATAPRYNGPGAPVA